VPGEEKCPMLTPMLNHCNHQEMLGASLGENSTVTLVVRNFLININENVSIKLRKAVELASDLKYTRLSFNLKIKEGSGW
jgi:hypothetical protein